MWILRNILQNLKSIISSFNNFSDQILFTDAITTLLKISFYRPIFRILFDYFQYSKMYNHTFFLWWNLRSSSSNEFDIIDRRCSHESKEAACKKVEEFWEPPAFSRWSCRVLEQSIINVSWPCFCRFYFTAFHTAVRETKMKKKWLYVWVIYTCQRRFIARFMLHTCHPRHLPAAAGVRMLIGKPGPFLSFVLPGERYFLLSPFLHRKFIARAFSNPARDEFRCF